VGSYCLYRGSFRHYRNNIIDFEDIRSAVKMKGKDVLNFIAFLFTILIVLYGLSRGFDTIELFLHVIYFVVLILSQLENLRTLIKMR